MTEYRLLTIWPGWQLRKRMESGKPHGRIEGLMAASLTYVLWFGLFPLLRLAG